MRRRFRCELCGFSKLGPRHLLMRLCDKIASVCGDLAWRLDTRTSEDTRSSDDAQEPQPPPPPPNIPIKKGVG